MYQFMRLELAKLANGDTEQEAPVESYDDQFRKPKRVKVAGKEIKYLLDQIPKEPKVRPAQAEAPEPKYRVKSGAAPLGVFGLPTKMNANSGFTPEKQLSKSQGIGVPEMEQPKVEPIKMKVGNVEHPGTLDLLTTALLRSAESRAQRKVDVMNSLLGTDVKVAMLDEMLKLNGMATTPKGRLHQGQIVGQPKESEPAGPSTSSLSKPYGYGHVQPGTAKNTI